MVLREFDGSGDPSLLVLYYHLRDRAYDGFNSPEYHKQMLDYYSAGMSVVCVVPRKIGNNDHLLVCLRHKIAERNTLCELAFQCMRQFCGVSMLVKRRCFVCNRPAAPPCACGVACFCSQACAARGSDTHSKLCKLVKASGVKVEEEEESLQLLQ